MQLNPVTLSASLLLNVPSGASVLLRYTPASPFNQFGNILQFQIINGVTPVITKILGSGISSSTTVRGSFDITLDSSETCYLSAASSYTWALTSTVKSNGAITAILSGVFSPAITASAVRNLSAASYNALVTDNLIITTGDANQAIVLPVTGMPVGKSITVKVGGAGVPVNVTAEGSTAIDAWSGGQYQLWNAPSTIASGSSATFAFDGVGYQVIGSV